MKLRALIFLTAFLWVCPALFSGTLTINNQSVLDASDGANWSGPIVFPIGQTVLKLNSSNIVVLNQIASWSGRPAFNLTNDYSLFYWTDTGGQHFVWNVTPDSFSSSYSILYSGLIYGFTFVVLLMGFWAVKAVWRAIIAGDSWDD